MTKFRRKSRSDELWGAIGADVPNEVKSFPDETFIDAAMGAARDDKLSRAYDDFLFSEDGLPQMPFEVVVDTRLALTSNRLAVRQAEALRKAEEQKLEVKAKLQELKLDSEKIASRKDALVSQLAEQKKILSGALAGHGGGDWSGHIPDTSSWWAARKRVLLPILVFMLVGTVDLGIIVNSFTKIHGFKFYEAWLFTAPAVGVQLVFPHMIGERLGELSRKVKHTKFAISQAAILAVVWLGFIAVMMEVRMNYIKSLSGARGIPGNLELALYVVNIILLLGLGMWLIFSAANRNRHETEYAKVSASIQRVAKKSAKLETKIAKVQTKLPLIEEARTLAKTSFDAAIASATSELSEATKAIYRRALVNAMGDVEFTNSYLRPENGFKRIK